MVKVADAGATVVYGYNRVLSPDEETATALCGNMTMIEISGYEFLAMDDENVRLIGCCADVDEYGNDVGSAWAAIGE